MSKKSTALIWAAIIISAALIAIGIGFNTGVSFGLVSGLSGAAWASLKSGGACGAGCLQ